MGKIVYHGKEYSSTDETTINVDFNDSGYSKEEVDNMIAGLDANLTNKETLEKISEDATDVKPLFNGKALAFEETIETSVADKMANYLTTDDASNLYASKSLLTATIKDVGVIENRLDNINDNIAPTNYYTKDETKQLIADAEVGLIVQFDSLTTEQKEQLKGEKGDKGNQGEKGDSAYASAVKLGYTGTEEDWVNSLKGASAYEIAVQQGYAYTEDAWLQSLKGEKGDKGDTGETGKSAYQIAVENGLTSASTQTEWIASLKGEQGDSIASVEQTTTGTGNGDENIITCTLTTGATSEFQIKNGTGIESVVQTTTSDVSDGFNVVTCTLTNGTTSEFNVKNGTGIQSVKQTTTSDVSGGTNTVTVTLSNGTTSTFDVKNGAEGYALIPTTQIDNKVGRIWLA